MTSLTVGVHAHTLIGAAEALVANEPGLAAARAGEARAAGAAEVGLARMPSRSGSNNMPTGSSTRARLASTWLSEVPSR